MSIMDDCRTLHRYWLTKHNSRALPAIRDFDPILEIPALVGNLMLLRRAEEGFRYQLVGSRIEAHIGAGMAGRRVEAGVPVPKLRTQWLAILTAVADTRQARLYEAVIPSSVSARFAALLMPLSDTAGPVSHILAALFFAGYLSNLKLIEALHERPLLE